ncbi:hypothetical protein BKA70DRAFT_1465389 [Coprinopsis sp. MPI-PUGE-AT-0042]|nr:hypothetical protein BKA70DRAFT_1465389 [Coprinopsis sp. MPI-PUGE-AT-0042]
MSAKDLKMVHNQNSQSQEWRTQSPGDLFVGFPYVAIQCFLRPTAFGQARTIGMGCRRRLGSAAALQRSTKRPKSLDQNKDVSWNAVKLLANRTQDSLSCYDVLAFNIVENSKLKGAHQGLLAHRSSLPTALMATSKWPLSFLKAEVEAQPGLINSTLKVWCRRLEGCLTAMFRALIQLKQDDLAEVLVEKEGNWGDRVHWGGFAADPGEVMVEGGGKGSVAGLARVSGILDLARVLAVVHNSEGTSHLHLTVAVALATRILEPSGKGGPFGVADEESGLVLEDNINGEEMSGGFDDRIGVLAQFSDGGGRKGCLIVTTAYWETMAKATTPQELLTSIARSSTLCSLSKEIWAGEEVESMKMNAFFAFVVQ